MKIRYGILISNEQRLQLAAAAEFYAEYVSNLPSDVRNEYTLLVGMLNDASPDEHNDFTA